MKKLFMFGGVLFVSGLFVSNVFAVSSNITIKQNIEYAQRDGERLTLNICSPKNLSATKKAPAVILTHGGGFRTGSPLSLMNECENLAEIGYVGVAVEYRLTTIAPYPAQIDDVQYAVRWVRAHANDYFIDPDRLGSLGGSAGGYLATMLGVQETRNPSLGLANYSSKVQVVIDRSGAPMDASDENTLPSADGQFGDERALILDAYLHGYEITTDLKKEISPITYVTADDAPLLAVYSSNDKLALPLNGEKIVNTLKSVGVDAQLVMFNGVGNAHGRERLPASEEAKLWKQEVAFLDKHLKNGDAQAGNAGGEWEDVGDTGVNVDDVVKSGRGPIRSFIAWIVSLLKSVRMGLRGN